MAEEAMPFTSTLEAAREGSAPALGTILESCRGYIVAVAQRQVPQRLKGRVQPSSLVQETYLRACRNFGQFRGQSEHQLLAWLRQIMIRSLITVLRQAEFKRNTKPLLSDLPTLAAPPDESSANSEIAQLLTGCLERLPEHYRAVIECRHFHRMSFDEIGQVMGCSADAARKVWARAQAKLGAEMQALR